MALTDKLTAIADAIRAKTGGSSALTLTQMAAEIASIGTEPLNAKCMIVNVAADQSARQVTWNAQGDDDIAAHRNDSSFSVGIIAMNAVSSSSTRAVFVTNSRQHQTVDGYGVYLRSSSSGLAAASVSKQPSASQESTAGTVSVDSSGVITTYASSTYPIRAGDYLVVCAWE